MRVRVASTSDGARVVAWGAVSFGDVAGVDRDDWAVCDGAGEMIIDSGDAFVEGATTSGEGRSSGGGAGAAADLEVAPEGGVGAETVASSTRGRGYSKSMARMMVWKSLTRFIQYQYHFASVRTF
jgi:hypothetical protein